MIQPCTTCLKKYGARRVKRSKRIRTYNPLPGVLVRSVVKVEARPQRCGYEIEQFGEQDALMSALTPELLKCSFYERLSRPVNGLVQRWCPERSIVGSTARNWVDANAGRVFYERGNDHVATGGGHLHARDCADIQYGRAHARGLGNHSKTDKKQGILSI